MLVYAQKKKKKDFQSKVLIFGKNAVLYFCASMQMVRLQYIEFDMSNFDFRSKAD